MSDLNIVGIEEIMISHFDIEKKYFLKIKSEELEKLIYSKFENSFRAYNIDENKFKLEGKKKINSSLSYKEKNYLGEIKKGMVRIVTWEILQNTNAYINEFPETLKEIDLKIDGNNYGCLNYLGDNLLIMLHDLQAFTNFSFNSGKKKLELTMESESSGKIKQKKSFFMNSDQMTASFDYSNALKNELPTIKEDLK